MRNPAYLSAANKSSLAAYIFRLKYAASIVLKSFPWFRIWK
jgi:hypothetical protein